MTKRRRAAQTAAPLSRDELLAHSNANAELEPVPVSQWGGTVYIRRLTANDQLALEPIMAQVNLGDADAAARFSVELVARSLADKFGKRLFGDTPEDHAALGELDPDGFIAVLQAVRAKQAKRKAARAKN